MSPIGRMVHNNPTALSGSPGIMVVMMENQQLSNIIGNTTYAPNINTLAGSYSQATNYYGDSHPSAGNYLALFTGQHALITDDNPPSSHTGLRGTTNIIGQMDAASIPWSSWFESLSGSPLTNEGSVDASGNNLYEVAHNPIAYVGTSTEYNAANTFTQTALDSHLNSCPTNEFVFVVPNMMDNMHDPSGTLGNDNTAISAGDTWLGAFITAVQATNWYTANGTILVIWDEAYDTTGGTVAGGFGSPAVNGGPIAMLAISQRLSGYIDFTNDITHIGMCQSIETFYGLSLLGGSGYGDISALLNYSAGILGPSGIALPAVDAYAGYTARVRDDFLGTSLDIANNWDAPGFSTDQGQPATPGGQQYGTFLATHGSVSGSMAQLSNYADPADLNYTGAPGGPRAGTGMYSQWSGTSGKIVVMARCDGGAGVTMCLGMIGTTQWPPEADFYEDATSDNTRTGTSGTLHWGASNSQEQPTPTPTGDFTLWHEWGIEYNSSTIKFTLDGTAWSTVSNPAPTGTDSFSTPMFLFMQSETRDGGTIQTTTPTYVNMQIDWVWIGT